jgi:hypothetical protein
MGSVTAEIEVARANMRIQCPQCDEWVRFTVFDIDFEESEAECWIRFTCPFCKTEVTVNRG